MLVLLWALCRSGRNPDLQTALWRAHHHRCDTTLCGCQHTNLLFWVWLLDLSVSNHLRESFSERVSVATSWKVPTYKPAAYISSTHYYYMYILYIYTDTTSMLVCLWAWWHGHAGTTPQHIQAAAIVLNSSWKVPTYQPAAISGACNITHSDPQCIYHPHIIICIYIYILYIYYIHYIIYIYIYRHHHHAGLFVGMMRVASSTLQHQRSQLFTCDCVVANIQILQM